MLLEKCGIKNITLLKIFRRLAYGLVGGILSPVTTLISGFKIMKIMKDPDLPLVCLDKHHSNLLMIRYKIPSSYLIFQVGMWALIITTMFWVGLAYFFAFLDGSTDTYGQTVGILCYGAFNITGGIVCCCSQDIFEVALSSILIPIKICFTCNRSKVEFLTDNLKNMFVLSVVDSNATLHTDQPLYRQEVHQELREVFTQNNPKQAMHTQLQSVLKRFNPKIDNEFEVIKLPADIKTIIFQYLSYYPSLVPAPSLPKPHSQIQITLT